MGDNFGSAQHGHHWYIGRHHNGYVAVLCHDCCIIIISRLGSTVSRLLATQFHCMADVYSLITKGILSDISMVMSVRCSCCSHCCRSSQQRCTCFCSKYKLHRLLTYHVTANINPWLAV